MSKGNIKTINIVASMNDTISDVIENLKADPNTPKEFIDLLESKKNQGLTFEEIIKELNNGMVKNVQPASRAIPTYALSGSSFMIIRGLSKEHFETLESAVNMIETQNEYLGMDKLHKYFIKISEEDLHTLMKDCFNDAVTYEKNLQENYDEGDICDCPDCCERRKNKNI